MAIPRQELQAQTTTLGLVHPIILLLGFGCLHCSILGLKHPQVINASLNLVLSLGSTRQA